MKIHLLDINKRHTVKMTRVNGGAVTTRCPIIVCKRELGVARARPRPKLSEQNATSDVGTLLLPWGSKRTRHLSVECTCRIFETAAATSPMALRGLEGKRKKEKGKEEKFFSSGERVTNVQIFLCIYQLSRAARLA